MKPRENSWEGSTLYMLPLFIADRRHWSFWVVFISNCRTCELECPWISQHFFHWINNHLILNFWTKFWWLRQYYLKLELFSCQACLHPLYHRFINKRDTVIFNQTDPKWSKLQFTRTTFWPLCSSQLLSLIQPQHFDDFENLFNF